MEEKKFIQLQRNLSRELFGEFLNTLLDLLKRMCLLSQTVTIISRFYETEKILRKLCILLQRNLGISMKCLFLQRFLAKQIVHGTDEPIYAEMKSTGSSVIDLNLM